LLLIVPCFWQHNIQAGDLSSHAYNAWLAHEATEGKLEGVRVAFQGTNILFDLMLSQFIDKLGLATGQKVSMALLVLILFWGSFAFVNALGAGRAWSVAPVLAMLAYGWTFHMGFCNFCLSTGLSLFYLSLSWKRNATRLAWALPVLGLAAAAHMLPVAWALCVQIYAYSASKLRGGRRPLLFGAALAGLLAIRWLLSAWFPIRWSVWQFLFLSGADQAWIYGRKYAAISFGLLFLASLAFLVRATKAGFTGLAGSVRLHIALLTAATIMILPNSVQLPQYNHALAYISQRMSLLLAVLLCAGLAAEQNYKRAAAVCSGFALIFFSFLYVDSRALNSLEGEMESLLSEAPPRERVISALSDSSARIDPLLHMADRACIGRCYSYANYEPSTAQFRVRADRGNRIVLTDYRDSYAVGEGTYAVKEKDGVLYQVRACQAGGVRLCLAALKPGDVTRKTEVQVLPRLW
jgi:hypothetical protein